jgi:hypothetical protein
VLKIQSSKPSTVSYIGIVKQQVAAFVTTQAQQ